MKINAGRLAVGAAADIVLFDPNAQTSPVKTGYPKAATVHLLPPPARPCALHPTQRPHHPQKSINCRGGAKTPASK